MLYELVDSTTVEKPHRAVVKVAWELLFELLLPPDGMRVVSMHVDPIIRSACFVVEHPDLKPVQIGHELPRLEATYTRHYESERVTAKWDGFG